MQFIPIFRNVLMITSRYIKSMPTFRNVLMIMSRYTNYANIQKCTGNNVTTYIINRILSSSEKKFFLIPIIFSLVHPIQLSPLYYLHQTTIDFVFHFLVQNQSFLRYDQNLCTIIKDDLHSCRHISK